MERNTPYWDSCVPSSSDMHSKIKGIVWFCKDICVSFSLIAHWKLKDIDQEILQCPICIFFLRYVYKACGNTSRDPSRTAFGHILFEHTPCLGFVLFSGGSFWFVIACRVFSRMWPSATFVFNQTPCLGFVLFFWWFLLIYALPAGYFLECGLRPHSFLITLLALALCCFLAISSNLWFACRVFLECGLRPHSFLITLLVWALCCFLVASSNL